MLQQAGESQMEKHKPSECHTASLGYTAAAKSLALDDRETDCMGATEPAQCIKLYNLLAT